MHSHSTPLFFFFLHHYLYFVAVNVRADGMLLGPSTIYVIIAVINVVLVYLVLKLEAYSEIREQT